MPAPPGSFEILDVDLAGRIARLHLKGGVLETPAFFPVIDPLRQEVSLNDIKETGFNQIITNAYLALKRFGERPGVSIRELLKWDGIVMTDSGAYQVLEYGSIGVSQERILEYQKNVLKPDIGVILDVPTGDVSRGLAEYTVRETLKRAAEALKIIDPARDSILWVLPIQGGKYLDLLAMSAEMSSRTPYRMYGIGSPTVFLEEYRYDIIVDMIRTAKSKLPPGRPVHLFGAGHPLILPFAVALGVDSFDSASYILYSRDGRYITEYGVVRLEELDYFPCSCPVCSKYEPRELLEMPPPERVRLLALHNLYVISRSIRRIKQAIREGRLWELLEETAHKHPAAHRALLRLRRAYPLLEEHAPRVKPRVKGLRLYGEESLWNPRLVRFRARIHSHYLPAKLPKLSPRISEILLLPMPKDVTSCMKPLESLGRTIGDRSYVIYYAPYIGLVPRELCGVYPSIHYDYAKIPRMALDVLLSEIASLYSLARRHGLKMRIASVSEGLCLELHRRFRGAPPECVLLHGDYRD